MTNTQAILIGAAIIAAAILAGNGVHPASAQMTGPFQLMHHSNSVANAGVFRLDTSTGAVSYCYIADANGGAVTCTRETK